LLIFYKKLAYQMVTRKDQSDKWQSILSNEIRMTLEEERAIYAAGHALLAKNTEDAGKIFAMLHILRPENSNYALAAAVAAYELGNFSDAADYFYAAGGEELSIQLLWAAWSFILAGSSAEAVGILRKCSNGMANNPSKLSDVAWQLLNLAEINTLKMRGMAIAGQKNSNHSPKNAGEILTAGARALGRRKNSMRR
jgi:tetratricopeptide (TPR) repeat protein